MKNTIAIFFTLLAAAAIGIAQPMTDIRVLNEDQRSVVLEFTPKIKAEKVLGVRGTVFTRYRFFGSHVIYDSTGGTDFIRPVILLLPSAQYSLQVLASEFQTRDTVKLAPKPTMKALKDFGFIESYEETNYAGTAAAQKQNVLAELINVGKTSTGYVGTLQLHPVKAVDREKVRLYTRIVVRLDFKNSFPAGLNSSCLLRGEIPQKALLAKMAKASTKKSIGSYPQLTQGEWYRLEVTETGMYKLNYAFLKNVSNSITNINSIRLYGNGGRAIPDDNTSPRPNALLEISRLVVDQNNNGILDPDDYIIFYGRGSTGWLYSGHNTYSHYINPYSDKNYYFLTFNQGAGKQMDTLSASAVSAAATKPTSFQEKLFVEEETYNLQSSGRSWVGEMFTGTDAGTYKRSLPGLVATSEITYKFKFLRRSDYYDNIEIFENNESLLSRNMGPGGVISDGPFASPVFFNAWREGGVPNDLSEVKIQVTGSQESKTWLDWMEIFYERRFEAVNDVLLFTSFDAAGLFQYDLGNFSAEMSRI